MEILAAVHRQTHSPLTVEHLDLGEPRTDEVRVRIVACGVCHTDLSVMEGHMPIPATPCVLGHEGAGVVECVGAGVRQFSAGDHVVLSFAYCGSCAFCTSDNPAYCERFVALNFIGRRLDGSCTVHQHGKDIQGSFFGQSSFATHVLATERSLTRIDSDLPLSLMAPLGCGIQTGAGGVLNCLRPNPGDSCAIFGMGAVGLAALMTAKHRSCDPLIAIDFHESRLALARELGATHALNAGDTDVVTTLKSLTGGGVNHAIEATGNAKAMESAVLALAPKGSALLLGMPPATATINFSARSLLNGRRILSSTAGDSIPQRFIPELIALYRVGALPLERIVREYPLDQINQAVYDAKSGATIKPVIRMPDVSSGSNR